MPRSRRVSHLSTVDAGIARRDQFNPPIHGALCNTSRNHCHHCWFGSVEVGRRLDKRLALHNDVPKAGPRSQADQVDMKKTLFQKKNHKPLTSSFSITLPRRLPGHLLIRIRTGRPLPSLLSSSTFPPVRVSMPASTRFLAIPSALLGV